MNQLNLSHLKFGSYSHKIIYKFRVRLLTIYCRNKYDIETKRFNAISTIGVKYYKILVEIYSLVE